MNTTRYAVALAALAATLAFAGPAAAQRPEITSVDPERLELDAGGEALVFSITGRSLEAFDKAVAVVDGRPSEHFVLDLEHVVRGEELRVKISARPGAAGLSAEVMLTSARQRLAVDGFKVTVAAVEPPVLASLTISHDSIPVGETATVTIVLDRPAPAGGTDITLASTSAEVALPHAFTLPEGATSGQFEVAAIGTGTMPVLVATVSAEVGGVIKGADITLVHPNPALTGLELEYPAVLTGSSVVATVTFGDPLPIAVTLLPRSGDPSVARIPPRVVVEAGATSATFPVVGEAAGTSMISVRFEGLIRETPVHVAAPWAPTTLHVGAFAVTILPFDAMAAFAPIQRAVGTFAVTIEPLGMKAEFRQVTLDVGTFAVTILPLSGNAPEERQR